MSGKNRPLIIAGNWKMYKTRPEAQELVNALRRALETEQDLPKIVLCPPFTSIDTVVSATINSVLQVGAQNMDHRDEGAFTGEISPVMLAELAVRFVIIGHSERRQFFGETNASVNLKLKAALSHGLVPIVCVGETIDERENHLTDAVVSRQIAAAVSGIDASDLKPLIIAYEPVWAIGTGHTCEASEANRVAKLIRATIGNLYSKHNLAESVPILYGGSVKAANIDAQLAESEIDGALVGGASLKADEFLSIVRSAQKQLQMIASRS